MSLKTATIVEDTAAAEKCLEIKKMQRGQRQVEGPHFLSECSRQQQERWNLNPVCGLFSVFPSSLLEVLVHEVASRVWVL